MTLLKSLSPQAKKLLDHKKKKVPKVEHTVEQEESEAGKSDEQKSKENDIIAQKINEKGIANAKEQLTALLSFKEGLCSGIL